MCHIVTVGEYHSEAGRPWKRLPLFEVSLSGTTRLVVARGRVTQGHSACPPNRHIPITAHLVDELASPDRLQFEAQIGDHLPQLRVLVLECPKTVIPSSWSAPPSLGSQWKTPLIRPSSAASDHRSLPGTLETLQIIAKRSATAWL
jgi:hypothetical protein